MKTGNTLQPRFLIILALVAFPFMSFGHGGEGEPESQAETATKVSEVKKISRYSLGFVVDLPSVSDVLTYVSEDLGIEIQDLEESNDPNYNPTSFDTRNCKVVQNENGTYEVQVRFYPPVDPMSIDDVTGVQKKSRILCTEKIDFLKTNEID